MRILGARLLLFNSPLEKLMDLATSLQDELESKFGVEPIMIKTDLE